MSVWSSRRRARSSRDRVVRTTFGNSNSRRGRAAPRPIVRRASRLIAANRQYCATANSTVSPMIDQVSGSTRIVATVELISRKAGRAGRRLGCGRPGLSVALEPCGRCSYRADRLINLADRVQIFEIDEFDAKVQVERLPTTAPRRTRSRRARRSRRRASLDRLRRVRRLQAWSTAGVGPDLRLQSESAPLRAVRSRAWRVCMGRTTLRARSELWYRCGSISQAAAGSSQLRSPGTGAPGDDLGHRGRKNRPPHRIESQARPCEHTGHRPLPGNSRRGRTGPAPRASAARSLAIR